MRNSMDSMNYLVMRLKINYLYPMIIYLYIKIINGILHVYQVNQITKKQVLQFVKLQVIFLMNMLLQKNANLKNILLLMQKLNMKLIIVWDKNFNHALQMIVIRLLNVKLQHVMKLLFFQVNREFQYYLEQFQLFGFQLVLYIIVDIIVKQNKDWVLLGKGKKKIEKNNSKKWNNKDSYCKVINFYKTIRKLTKYQINNPNSYHYICLFNNNKINNIQILIYQQMSKKHKQTFKNEMIIQKYKKIIINIKKYYNIIYIYYQLISNYFSINFEFLLLLWYCIMTNCKRMLLQYCNFFFIFFLIQAILIFQIYNFSQLLIDYFISYKIANLIKYQSLKIIILFIFLQQLNKYHSFKNLILNYCFLFLRQVSLLFFNYFKYKSSFFFRDQYFIQ